MANPYPVSITDTEGEARLTGFADFTDSGNQPGGAAFLGWTEDASNPANVETNGGNLTLTNGTLSVPGSGAINADGTIVGGVLQSLGQVAVGTTFAMGTTPAITGALSTVLDAPAKDVLTSIITALVGLGLATNGTT